jgi:hypothetical protein
MVWASWNPGLQAARRGVSRSIIPSMEVAYLMTTIVAEFSGFC